MNNKLINPEILQLFIKSRYFTSKDSDSQQTPWTSLDASVVSMD